MKKILSLMRSFQAPSLSLRAYSFELTAYAFLFFIAALLAKGLTNPGQVIMGPDTDLFYSFKYYWVESLKRGAPALWCPWLFLGIPFAAHPSVGAFSPFNLLFFLFDYPLAFNLQYILHYWLCACGVLLFMRRLGCGWAGSLLAALGYSFCSFFVSRMFWGQHAMVWAGAWLPWMLYFLDRALRENKLWLLGLASASVALCFFEGYPQIMLYSLMTCGFYLLYLALARAVPFSRALLAGAALVGVFLLLAACQFLPTLEFTRLSNRSHWGYGQAMSEYLKPLNFLFFFNPDFQGRLEDNSWKGLWGYFEAVNYVGLLPALLFTAGLFLVRRVRHYVFFLSLAVLFGVLSMGDSTFLSRVLFKLFFEVVPGFAQQRSIGRMMMVTSFAVACGAGLVLDLLAKRRRASDPSRAPAWVPWVLGLVLLFTAVDMWKFGRRFIQQVKPDHFTNRRFFPETLTQTLLDDKSYPRFQPYLDKSRNLYFQVSQLFFDDQLYPAGDVFFRIHPIWDTPVADLLSLKYIWSLDKLSEEHWEKFDAKHFINKRAFPRAFLAGGYKYFPWDWDQAYALMKSGQLDLRAVLLLKEEPDWKADFRPGIAGEASITHYSDNRVEIDCEASRPCFLFLADNYFPGWKVQVDGRETPTVLADIAFRAVPIKTAGKHHVVMKYRPVPLYAGCAVSLVCWLGLMALVLKGRGLRLDLPPKVAVLMQAVFWLGNTNVQREDAKMLNKKAVYEYNGWSFSKPPAKEAAEIKKRAAAMRSGRSKSVPLSELIKKLEKI